MEQRAEKPAFNLKHVNRNSASFKETMSGLWCFLQLRPWGDLWPVPLLIHYYYHTISWETQRGRKTTDGKLIGDYFANWKLVKSITGFSFSNVKDKDFSLSFVIVNSISLIYGQISKLVTLGSGKLPHFSLFLDIKFTKQFIIKKVILW